MFNLEKMAPATYKLPKTDSMLVEGLVIATENQIHAEDLQKPLQQVCNVACLPGIVGYSIAMPDIHWGYGFPIGGVAAMDVEEGVISPGGVGYDINCGVRLALVPIPFSKLTQAQKQSLLAEIFATIPSGAGKGHKTAMQTLSLQDFVSLERKGALFAVEKGYGFSEDLEHTESYGKLDGADSLAVSEHAKERGKSQMGTIGSGNHFVEIGEVQEILLPDIAKAWNITEKQTYVLIHTGSRGFGHQICQDTLESFIQKGFHKNLPDKQLVAAPLKSPEGKQYFSAMAMAANFAFSNRQTILHFVREAFKKVCNISPSSIPLLYDVCHNIAKIETHIVAGSPRKLCVHRKGATRALGKDSSELPLLFQKTGQPVLIPGDMGRASYIMVGQGNPLTWCSACHGAGRQKSRMQSLKSWKDKNAIAYLKQLGVEVSAYSMRTIIEEMPDAYRDVQEVVHAVEEANLAKKVAKLRPFLIVKG